MIDKAAHNAIEKARAIEKVLCQAGGHKDVSAVEVGHALAPLQLWLEALQELQRVSSGINLPDIKATEEFLAGIESQEGSSPDEFVSLHRILEQQRYLAGLQSMEIEAIQQSLAGSQVSFNVPAPLVVAKWLKERGYMTYVPLRDNYDPSVNNWKPGDLSHTDTLFGIYKHQPMTARTASFFGIGKHTEITKWVDIERICSLRLEPKPWQMRVCGEGEIPEALMLARGISELTGEKIDAMLSTEHPFSKRIYPDKWETYYFKHSLPVSY